MDYFSQKKLKTAQLVSQLESDMAQENQYLLQELFTTCFCLFTFLFLQKFKMTSYIRLLSLRCCSRSLLYVCNRRRGIFTNVLHQNMKSFVFQECPPNVDCTYVGEPSKKEDFIELVFIPPEMDWAWKSGQWNNLKGSRKIPYVCQYDFLLDV